MSSSVSPRPVYIYALLDPRTEEVRYIGRTTDPERRLLEHTQANHLGSTTWRTRWLKGLLGLGLRPFMRVLEQTTDTCWREAEQRHIAAHLARGCRLTNATAGGDGMLGWVAPPETRQKMSQARQGRPGRVWTDEQRAAKAAQMRGRGFTVQTPEQVAKRAATQKGTVRSAEQRARLSAAHKGYNPTAEHRAKLSVAGKGRVLTAEHRAKIGMANRGHHRPWSAARRTAYERRYGAAPTTAQQLALGI